MSEVSHIEGVCRLIIVFKIFLVTESILHFLLITWSLFFT